MFAKRILSEYTAKQNEKKLAKRWANFQKFLSKKEFIKKAKEEVYQEGFLKDIFEKCLGYTLESSNPNNYNLKREEKTEIDSKKADGVIIVDGKIVGVIELKSQKTKDLENAVNQAFNYLNSHTYARYVIVSNFNELRFFVDKKTAYEKFNLFDLTYEEFKRLHLLLSIESIKENLPIKLKEKSLNFEKEITDNLYKDYSEFRNNLFEDIIKNNNIDKLKALHLTQKLCDRIVFILFAEDRGLLRSNTIKEIREKYKNDIFDHSLYDYYKIYFKAIYEGNKKLDIPKYGGGLFAPDSELESLIISDECLDLKAQKLSDYDFLSDIDVNILGHIFEQSLNDIEEITAQIKNTSFDKKKSKRKKEGIFYTPKYITEYIVENTIGKLCEEKKKSLNLDNLNDLLEYRKWLLGLKILDPACGSGAFLNQALEFLINEHKMIDKKRRELEGDLLGLYDIEEDILQNNLYGIDINKEAIEIAKLSLWLRTAKRGKTLTNLSDKIVVANSLLEDPFSFKFKETSASQIAFAGFDVVIGNPPYGAKLENEKEFFEIKSNESAILFMQKAYDLLKEGGYHSFIIPKPFIYASTWKKIREKFLDEIFILADVKKAWREVKLEQIIYALKKGKKFKKYENYEFDKTFKLISLIDKEDVKLFDFILNGVNEKEINLAKKIEKNTKLSELSMKYHWGDTFFKVIKEEGKIPVLGGANIQRYEIKGVKGYIDDIEVSDNAKISKNSVLLQRLIAHIQHPVDHIKITGTVVNNEKYYILNTIQEITLKEYISNKYILALLHSKLINWYVYRFIFAKAIRTFQFTSDTIKKIPIPPIPNTEKYLKNIEYLMNMPNKEKYDKTTKYPVALIDGREVYMTEFLAAKQFGYIEKFHGHKELRNYMRLIPYLTIDYFDDIFKNINNKRIIYSKNENDRKIFHIIDENDFLVSVFVVSKVNFEKQLNRRFKHIKTLNPSGRAATSSILSPARPFWRHSDLLEQLYHKLKQNSISQNDFISLVDDIIKAKEKISTYKKYLEGMRGFRVEGIRTLSATEKVEILEEIEKLEKVIKDSEEKIDNLVYKLYNLSDEEIKLIEGKK